MPKRVKMRKIAAECGFSSAARMRLVFQRIAGMTPLEYHRLHGIVAASKSPKKKVDRLVRLASPIGQDCSHADVLAGRQRPVNVADVSSSNLLSPYHPENTPMSQIVDDGQRQQVVFDE